MEEVNYKEEVEALLKEKTEAEISEEFLEEFKKLCEKYNRDFYTDNIKPQIVKIEFKKNDISGILPTT